jgi:Dullard-like phosphatase family protein
LAKIAINPVAGENKDIHLVLDGKEETIINYTNQEMVDDENEYMVECLKVLLKLNMEEQPRCKQKVNFNFPKEGKNKKIALFDLDETLVHCTKDKKGINGDTVNVKLPTNKIVTVGLNIRSNWKEALDLIKDHYYIVVYTASHQSYADAVLNYLDKENKYFQYRLYRNHCVQCNVEGIKFYVKDLDTLNEYYNLKDVVLIDNSVLSFAYHLNNGIPIVPFIEQQNDTQLLMLAYYLVSIANFDDLTQENKKHINIEHFLLMAKKLSEEESEEEDDKENDNITASNKNQESIEDNKNETNAITYTNKDTKDTNDKSEINNDDLKSHKTTTKSLLKNSEKALKIAEGMKKSIDDIYKTNYNEKE